MSGKLLVVVGGQYGSEAKGHVADQLSRPDVAGDNVVVVRVAGPNAGHTVYGQCPSDCRPDDSHMSGDLWIGHPWRLRSVPVGAVSNPNADLVIAAGSEIDYDVLMSEVVALDAAGYRVSSRLVIDAQATMLEPKHIEREVEDKIQERLGSTAKGIGAARADRIWRYATLWGDRFPDKADAQNSAEFIRARLAQGATVVIEGTQGYGLGLHAGHYPQCTSSDCRAIDFLAMAGVSPWWPEVAEFGVWVVARVRPIRVAGNSGPIKGETSWSELGLPEERTTVTNKVRRVGEWDGELVAEAVRANGSAPVVRLALTMVDTVFPEVVNQEGTLGGVLDARRITLDQANAVAKYIAEIEAEVGAPVRMVATSPTTVLWRP
ncbi:PurA-like adenylosuccinate synthetase [Streptomyces phage Galactica]|nr:PurA-like adenylosuccinate synthetase [Streptomyces phage Galactica]